MEKLKELMKMIKKLYDGKFYGELRIQFTDGKPVSIKKTESIKI